MKESDIGSSAQGPQKISNKKGAQTALTVGLASLLW